MENLIINGCNFVFNATLEYTIYGPKKISYKFCSVTPSDILDSEGNIRIKDNIVVDDSENNWKGAITFTPLPKLTVKPVQEGTAHFTLKAGDDEFEDVGFFANGTTVTITCKPASGFKFARWTDDASIPSTREYNKQAGDEELEALFYYKAESDADWFGVNGDKFVKFSFRDNAEKVATSTNTLTNVKGGDYMDGRWIFVEDEDIKKFSFNGTLKDGEEVKGKIESYNDKPISGVTDMTYDIIGGSLYAVAGSKLYRITNKESKEIATFKLDGVETQVVSIACDADGNKYALVAGAEGKLYTFSISGEEAKLKIAGKKDNEGKIGIKVAYAPQSIAFDLSTGELFWGASDYLRIINLEKMKTFIAGDLGKKGGSQGFIQSLHRMTELVTVTVMIAEGQEAYGTVTVGETTSTKKKPEASESYVEGEPVTITATANEGYYFSHWEIEGDKKHKAYEDETMEITAEDITYVAYFEEAEGIESVSIDSTLNTQKVMIDGALYILRDGNIYTPVGQKVK
jgi:hypothetical protein